MTTARSIIEQAHKKINVLGVGQTLSAEEAADSLTALNNLLADWSVQGGLVFTETRETFTLTSGQAQYTIGSGQDFNTDKPYIIQAAYVSQGVNDYPLEDYDQKQYATITNKSTGGLPAIYYYDNNFPVANLFVHPVPNSGETITLYSSKVLESFDNLTTDISMPAGYERALVYNLAVDRAPDYEKEASQTVKDLAGETKGSVFASNNRNENNISYVDDALLQSFTYNIYRGT